MKAARSLLVALAAVFCIAAASDPSERLPDPAQEARARAIFREVRCLICQSESIDDSESPFAQTARAVIRDQVVAGSSDQQIKRFLMDRYGEYILLKPPFSPGNWVLWLAPFGLVLVGAAGLVLLLRRREAAPPLSAEEEAKIAALMND